MPAPSSATRIRRRPPPSVAISTRVAPASSAFSTSSLTTLAGRSTTSPAAMRLTSVSESWRTGMGEPDSDDPRIYRRHGGVARARAQMPPLFVLPAEPFGAQRDKRDMSILPIASDYLFLHFAAAFALCALACGLILAGRISIRRAAESERWPAVEGIVIDSTVDVQRGGKQL